MSYKGPGKAVIPFGGSGMRRRSNRLTTTVDDLLVAKEVDFSDDLLAREPADTPYDSSESVIGLSPFGYVTFDADEDGVMGGQTFTGPASITFDTSKTNNKEQATWTTNSLTLTTVSASIGSLIVVAVASSTNNVGYDVAITDTAGNTYVEVFNTLGSGVSPCHALFYCRVTSTLSSGTITASFTGHTSSATVTGLTMVGQQFLCVGGSNVTAGPELLEDSFSNDDSWVVRPSNLTAIVDFPVLSVITTTTVGASANPTPRAGFITDGQDNTNGATVDIETTMYYRINDAAPFVIAATEFASDDVASTSGVVQVVEGATFTQGIGTSFTDEYATGDEIALRGEVRTVEAVVDNTEITVSEPWSTTVIAAPTCRRGPRFITVTNQGNMFRDIPATFLTGDLDGEVLTGILSRRTQPGWFCVGGKEAAAQDRKLFYYNGVDPILVVTGHIATAAGIATPPADWDTVPNPMRQPVAGTIHASRHVAFGNWSDPHRLYFSSPDNHELFTGADTYNIPVRSSIGRRLYSAISFQGVLWAFKWPTGIFYLDDSDLTPGNWEVRTKSEALGIAPSPYAALPLDDDIMLLAPDGNFHMLSAVSELGGVRASNITRRLGLQQWIKDNVNLEQLRLVQSVWVSSRKQAFWMLPASGDDFVSILLKFDFGAIERGGGVRVSYSERFEAGRMALSQLVERGQPETMLVIEPGAEGAVGGFVGSLMWQDGPTLATSTVETAELDFGDLEPALRWTRKSYDHLELLFDETGAVGDVQVKVYVDGTLKQTLTFDPTMREQKRKLNVGDGFNIKLVIEDVESTPSAVFRLLAAVVYFSAKGEDTHR
jgi:hypothetical protein